MTNTTTLTKPVFITADWNAPKNVKTLITTRVGGFSTGNYGTFNLAFHVEDNLEIVEKNRQILSQYLPGNPYWLNQIHSNIAVDLDDSQSLAHVTVSGNINADASFTTIKNTVCTVMTADCLPIFLTDTSGRFVAAIHAGWKGLYNEIIKNTIELILNKTKIDIKNIIAYIGTAICQKHYEVNHELFDKFTALNKDNEQFFSHKPNHKFNCNLAGIAQMQLKNTGVLNTNTFLSKQCTFCDSELFYSYRKQSITGRFASYIWLE